MSEQQTKIKYFLYARKSSESEDRQVQSIDDQVDRLNQLVSNLGLSIKKVFTESKSAKMPDNRPKFEEMLERIEKGEAGGILCWQINRLSRNPIDSGKLQWLLQKGILKSIQTIDREYKSEDNVLLFSVESGMANQFIIDLRKNTMRGMESKLQKGWMPALARLGYLNDKLEHTIIKDPERFDAVRKMWNLMLTGNYSISQILNIITNEWGFTTVKRKRRGGTPLSLGGLYSLFSNKFYAGIIEWDGKEYQGNHEAMITLEEFERVQKLMGKNIGKPRPQTHQHPYTGLITCGECGAMITASTKYKKIKSTGETHRYDYYHCTLRKKYVKCTQRTVVKENVLEEQIEKEILKYTILPEFRDWALEILNSSNDKEIEDRSKIHEMRSKTLLDTQAQLDSLTKMRYRDLITDDEFIKERNSLQTKIVNFKQQLRETEGRAETWLELTEKTFDFVTYAHSRFLTGGMQTKKEILSALGQNLTLKDGTLSIQANKWLEPIAKHYPALEAEYLRLELGKSPLNAKKKAARAAIISGWGA